MSALIESIRQDVIGSGIAIETPFGKKPLVYADYTASGRALNSIETFIQQQVLPWYANTHSDSSITGRQTGALREQARQTILEALNAGDDYWLIFCGSGATAAINKLQDILNLRLPADLDRRYRWSAGIPEAERPVVFIGPYEHHSNELPWRESIADVISIPLDDRGYIDQQILQQQLQNYQDRPMLLASFSAASNVTGIKSDVDAISALLHRYGGLVFWDYAAAAPYTRIDMQGAATEAGDTSKDAVFISPHKFIGGPGTPGVLVVRKKWVNNSVPVMPGGGTVSFVSPDEHQYVDNAERREEGGTPAIIESIRAGLVFKLQQQVGLAVIEEKEQRFIRQAIQRWSDNPDIEILGPLEGDRLSIVSMQIRCAGKYLHYGFVVALLNDLFGIQARGGCSCAGPYGHQLLGIDKALSKEIEAAVSSGLMIIRPGWVRISFNYFISRQEFDYLVAAIDCVASEGWKLLPFYQFDESSGCWRYQGQSPELACSLQDFQLNAPPLKAANQDLQQVFKQAVAELNQPREDCLLAEIDLPGPVRHLRWFTVTADLAGMQGLADKPEP